MHPLVEAFERASEERRRRYVAERLAGPMSDDVFAAICEGIRRSAERHPDLQRAPASSDDLTKREAEVLQLVAEGLTSKHVARQLFIAHSTVKNHLAECHRKLGVCTRTAAVRRGVELGYVDWPVRP